MEVLPIRLLTLRQARRALAACLSYLLRTFSNTPARSSSRFEAMSKARIATEAKIDFCVSSSSSRNLLVA